MAATRKVRRSSPGGANCHVFVTLLGGSAEYTSVCSGSYDMTLILLACSRADPAQAFFSDTRLLACPASGCFGQMEEKL